MTPDDGPPRRAGAQVAWLDRPHQTPAVKDRNPVRDRLDIGQDVRREQHRDPALALLEDQLAHVAPAEGIEPAHRLIEDQDLGIVNQRRREPEALEHALRVLPQP